MEKILKVLHKKLDTKENVEFFKQKNKEMESLFNFDKIPFVNKKEFDFYKNEIIYYGILNKQAIEKAYKKARIDMEDYYDTLNYEQKYKLMDYEIKKCLEDLNCFKYEEDDIYIPFFDVDLNRTYKNEMTLFDIKKYADLMLFYKEKMQMNRYGYAVYNSAFSSLQYILESNTLCAVYCEKRGRLYFLNAFEMEDYISIKNASKSVLETIAVCYFKKDVDGVLHCLYEHKALDEKTYNKIMKKRK